jgi:hypothetical protein
MALNNDMGRKHEEDVAEVFGARLSRSSGNQWNDQMDGRMIDGVFRFAFDCKSRMAADPTRANGLSLTDPLWQKAERQAAGARVMVPLRWYRTESLKVGRDLVAVSLDDMAEMMDWIGRVTEAAGTEDLFAIIERLKDHG